MKRAAPYSYDSAIRDLIPSARRKILGYRSNVAYTIRFTSDDDRLNEQTFFTFIAEAKSDEVTRQAIEECEVDEVDLRINFVADDIKWYDSHSDVASHDALIDLAEETINSWEGDKECMGYIFVRCGENEDDTEIKASGRYDFQWLWVRRTIERDW